MNIERPLGDNEKMTWLMDQAAPMNFVMIARVEGAVNVQAVRDALDAVTKMHSLLTTHIEKRGESLWLVTNSELKPFLSIINRENDEQWRVEAEKEMNTPFDSFRGPLLRVTLLHSPQESDLLFTFFHCIGDANSGVYALRDFLSFLSQWKPGTAPVVQQIYPARPAVEELLPSEAHGWSKLTTIVKLIVKQTVANFSDRPRKLDVVETPRKQRVSRMIHAVLPKETVDGLVAKCRDNNTTIQGALCASLLMAISRKIQSGDKLTMSCCSVVDLRKKLSPQLGDEIGMLASGVITSHTLRPIPPFWSLARDIKQGLNRGIASGELYVTMTMVGNLIPKNSPPEVVCDKLTEVFPYASIVTNIGRVEIPEGYGEYQLKKLHFAVSLKSLAAREFNLAVATFGEQMYINFLYTAPNLSEEIANEIAGDTIAILNENLFVESLRG